VIRRSIADHGDASNRSRPFLDRAEVVESWGEGLVRGRSSRFEGRRKNQEVVGFSPLPSNLEPRTSILPKVVSGKFCKRKGPRSLL
jgi:hypothetical protein